MDETWATFLSLTALYCVTHARIGSLISPEVHSLTAGLLLPELHQESIEGTLWKL